MTTTVSKPTTPLVSANGWVTDAGSSRVAEYEMILGEIATGVFILETAIAGDPTSLEVVVVNEMGSRFFGRGMDDECQVLAEAGH